MTVSRDHSESRRPLAPTYPFVEPSTNVELYAGQAMLGDDDIGYTKVWLTMTGELSIRWAADDGCDDIGPAVLRLNHPEYGAVQIATHVTSTAGRGSVDPSDLGSRTDRVSHVIAHWINLPPVFPAEELVSGGANWSGRWTCEAAGWRFVLDARPDLPARADEFGNSHEYVITHTGHISRANGTTFTADDVEDVLYAWQTALSFALGRWVTPALPVGYDDDRRVWERWTPWRGDRAFSNYHWWDTHKSDDLADFTQRFISAWFSPDHDAIRHLAHHMISANHATTTMEARLMLAQAGLEYLAWVDHVLTNRMSKKDFEQVHAAERIRLLLRNAGVPVDLPSELAALKTIGVDDPRDGAHVLTWMRNRLVHPKDAAEPYRIEHALTQAWQLSMHYGELLLLHRLGYQGSYLKRFPPGRWAHDSTHVPWRDTVSRDPL